MNDDTSEDIFAPSSPPFPAHDDDDDSENDGFVPSSPPPFGQEPHSPSGSPEFALAPSSPPDGGAIEAEPSSPTFQGEEDDDDEANNDDGFAPSSPSGQPLEEEESNTNDKDESNAANGGGGEWQAYQDDEGNTYYYNESTGESTWDKPKGFVEDAERTTNETTSPTANKGGETPPEHDPFAEGDDEQGDSDEPAPASTQPKSETTEQSTTTAEDSGTDSKKYNYSWQAFQDDDGRTYYYNETTEVTQWERPSSIPPTPEREAAAAEKEEAEGEGTEEPDFDDAGCTASPSYDDTQQPTNETEEPEDATMKEKDTEKDSETKEREEVVEPEVEEKIDPIEEAQNALKEVDALLEPSTPNFIAELVRAKGPAEGFGSSIQSLTNGYQGLTAMCGLLSKWTVDLAQKTHPTILSPTQGPDSNKSNNTNVQAAADNVRSIAEKVIRNIVLEKFNKTGEDQIFTLSKKEIAFLDQMTDDPRWRKLLIDLSAKHKQSALLMFVLNKISSKGYHREIAGRINQSDYFDVYHQLLVSEIGIIGKCGVGVQQDLGQDGVHTLDNVGKDLRKICTTTAYTYLHAQELLSDLVKRTKEQATEEGEKNHSGKKSALERAASKWERLSEDLERTLLNGQGGEVSKTSALAQKRPIIEMACVMTELHARKRRQLAPNKTQQSHVMVNKDIFRNSIDDAVLKIMKQHCLGMVNDILLVDKLLRLPKETDSDTTTRKDKERDLLYVGEQLISHPKAMEALQTILFKPGSTVVKSPLLVKKCAAAVARATVAARRATFGSNDVHAQIIKQRERLHAARKASKKKKNEMEDEDKKDEDDEDDDDSDDDVVDQVVTLEQELDMIASQVVQGSELCEQVGNMVSFVVLDDPYPPAKYASVGRRLSATCILSAPVARGVIFWALELAKGPEFASSAAYPTLTPCILSLARIIAKHHPYARPDVMELGFVILALPVAGDMSYQKAQALKEQCLRLLLILSTQGMALDVLYRVAQIFQQGASSTMLSFDSATIRYFIGGLLQVIECKNLPSRQTNDDERSHHHHHSHNYLSVSFVKCLTRLLHTKLCKDAIQSAYFDLNYKIKTKLLVKEMIWMLDHNKELTMAVSNKERKSILALQTLYGNL